MVIPNCKPAIVTALLVAVLGHGLIAPVSAAPATVDPRQTFAAPRGGLDELGFGHSRAQFGRHLVLRDTALAGAGLVSDSDALGLTGLGRSFGAADFVSRFHYATPMANGLQMSLEALDPADFSRPTGLNAGGLLDDNRSARVAGEISYSSAFLGGRLKAWVDALWQTTDDNGSINLDCASFGWDGDSGECHDINGHGWGVGSKLDYLGFELVGYLRDGYGLVAPTPFDHNASGNGDAYFVQGSYAVSSKTTVGVSYGEGNVSGIHGAGIAANTMGSQLEHQLWTVGVYHDVSTWLRLIAEYNHGELNTQAPGKNPSGNTISVGSFLYW